MNLNPDDHSTPRRTTTPPEVHGPGHVWTFDNDIPRSDDTTPRHGPETRWDPYYEPDLHGPWVHHHSPVDLPKKLQRDPAKEMKYVRSVGGKQPRLRALAALLAWPVMTAEQIATIVGEPKIASPLNRDLASMFASGLVSLSPATTAAGRRNFSSPRTLVRANRDRYNDTLARINGNRDSLTHAEVAALSQVHTKAHAQDSTKGNIKTTTKRRAQVNVRHDTLSVELALRIAEYGTNVAMLLGENYSNLNNLITNDHFVPFHTSEGYADATILRNDGLRIAIELTANAGNSFRQKVERYARLLKNNTLEDTGLCVVFVLAAPHNNPAAQRQLRAKAYRAIAAACREHPGPTQDPTAARIGVATWRQWFPGPGLMHEAFTTMRVECRTRNLGYPMTSAETPEDRWEPWNFLSPHAVPDDELALAQLNLGPLPKPRTFTPNRADLLAADMRRYALLGQTPIWLHNDWQPPQDLRELLHERNGLTADNQWGRDHADYLYPGFWCDRGVWPPFPHEERLHVRLRPMPQGNAGPIILPGDPGWPPPPTAPTETTGPTDGTGGG